MEAETAGRRRRGGRAGKAEAAAGDAAREVDYRRLRNPFPLMPVFSEDRIEAIHQASLKVLEELGMKVLLPEARQIFARGGAIVDEDSQMVRIGRDMVDAAVASAPPSFTVHGGNPERDLTLELGSIVFQPGAGCPHATDLVRGRRPGSLSDFTDLIRLTQHFDVLHMIPPLVEPQDEPIHLRHYAMTRSQMKHTDKVPFIYSRGTPQVEECFEMIRNYRGLTDEAFFAEPHCYSIINTNSPRQLDIPMAQGLIDFARARQMMIITPFTLMGAMAPITVAGALTLSHAEALAALTLSQLANPGAPVCYGTFTSNVDMKSGAPAFGTPEHFRANLGAGQLARRVGLPWRSASGSAANTNDAQAANETLFGNWGCLLAGATVIIHSAGWLEGGLTVSYEKLITDVEMLQMVAELCNEADASDAAIGFDALTEVQPGGHFFAAGQTMQRYRNEFYEPIVHDWSNFGQWTERGARDASARATDIWQAILHAPSPVPVDVQRLGDLDDYIARRVAAGGAAPVS